MSTLIKRVNQLTQGFDFRRSSSLDDDVVDEDDESECAIKSVLLFVPMELRFDLIDGDEFES